MNLKKKFEDVKIKCKEHAPVIITAATSAAAITALIFVNHRTKTNLDGIVKAREEFMKGDHVYLTPETTSMLRNGGEYKLVNDCEDFDLILHRLEETED